MANVLLQLVGDYLDKNEFYVLYKIYKLSIIIYIKNKGVALSANHINWNILEYALKYDIPEYVHLSCDNFNLQASYKSANTILCGMVNTIPNIIKYNYLHNGLRLNKNCLGDIFIKNNIELMKFIQNYPEKSNISVYKINLKDLWQLNYKHKIAYTYLNVCTKYFYVTLVCIMICVGSITHYICDNAMINFGLVPRLILACICWSSMFIFAKLFNTILNAKLPL